jgi:hypothetical protein
VNRGRGDSAGLGNNRRGGGLRLYVCVWGETIENNFEERRCLHRGMKIRVYYCAQLRRSDQLMKSLITIDLLCSNSKSDTST